MSSPLPNLFGARESSYGGQVHNPFDNISPRNTSASFNQQFAAMNVNDQGRSNSRLSRSTSSAGSYNGNKNYRYFSYKKNGNDWYSAQPTEIGAAQDDLAKKVKKWRGNTSTEMKRMGNGRRALIDNMTRDLQAYEVDGSSWEPVFIEDTNSQRDSVQKNVIKTTAFDVIFARRSNAPSTPNRERRQSNVSGRANQRPSTNTSRDVPVTARRPSMASSIRSPRQSSIYNDVFASNPLFSEEGSPMGEQGPISYNNGGLPDHIQRERPIGSLPPIITDTAPAGEAIEGPLGGDGVIPLDNLDAILGGNNGGDGIHVIQEEPHVLGSGRRERQLPLRQQRRQSSNVRIETRSPENYSNRSSFVSDSHSVFDAGDDVSSRTSDDTSHSVRSNHHGQQKYHRRSYIRDADAPMIIPETNRRRPTQIDPRFNSAHGIEQNLHNHRRSSSNHHQNRPVVHQGRKSFRDHSIPPPAPEVADYHDRTEHGRTQRILDEYAQDTLRAQEEARRANERLIAHQDQERARRQQEKEAENERARQREAYDFIETGGYRAGNVGRNGSTRAYNYEPRNRAVPRPF